MIQRGNVSKLGGKNNLNCAEAIKEQNNRLLRTVSSSKQTGTLLKRMQAGCYSRFSPNLQSRRRNMAKKWKDNHSPVNYSLCSKQVFGTFPKQRGSSLFFLPLQPSLCVIEKCQRVKTKQKQTTPPPKKTISRRHSITEKEKCLTKTIY